MTNEKPSNSNTEVTGNMELQGEGGENTQNQDSYEEYVEPGFWKTKGVRWILSIGFMVCIAFNLLYFFEEGH